MVVKAGPMPIYSNLSLYLDAANANSYSGTGNTWYDLSGNSNNGSIANSASYSTTNKGSFYFNGSSQYISVNNNSNLIFSSSDAMSLSVWFKPTVLQNVWTGIVTKSRDVSPWYGIWINPSNQIVWGHPLSNMIAQVTDTNWQNVVITKDTSGHYIYVNGVLKNSSSSTLTANGTGALYIGGAASVSEYFTGYVGNVKVYNNALSQTQILQNFNAFNGRYGI